MNRITRVLAASLSLSLILSAPGLVSYQAVAQTIGSTRIAVPIGSLGASGAAAINGLGGSASMLPAANLQPGLISSLSPSAALMPVLSAPIAAANAAVPIALINVIVPAAAAPVTKAVPTAAVAALRTGATALSVASKTGSQDAPIAALNSLFEGTLTKPESLAVSALSAPSDSPRLDQPGQRGPPKGPRWVKTFQAPNDAPPTTSVKRTLSIGFLAAVIPITLTMVTVVIAQLLGYELHPNYQGPAGTAAMTLLQAVAVWIGAAVMAPVSEEAIFRGGMQGRLAKISAKFHLGSFVAPAVITSLIFVALHETSDPVLFATRFVHAMILSYVYQKEGILAAMAAHGFFNGLLALSIVFTAIGMPLLGLAVVPAALYFAVKAAKVVRAQKPDIASGALAPIRLNASLSFLLAGVLMLGYFFIMPNIFWPIGAVALLIKGMLLLKSKKA